MYSTIGMAAAEATVNMGNSIWDYIDLHRAKSSVFHNFHYLDEETQDMVCPLGTRFVLLCVIALHHVIPCLCSIA